MVSVLIEPKTICLTVGADPGDAGSLSFDEVLVRALQLCEGHPFLAVPVHELAFIQANWTIVRWFNTGRELRAVGRANPGLHLGHYISFRVDVRKFFRKLLSKPGKGGASLGAK